MPRSFDFAMSSDVERLNVVPNVASCREYMNDRLTDPIRNSLSSESADIVSAVCAQLVLDRPVVNITTAMSSRAQFPDDLFEDHVDLIAGLSGCTYTIDFKGEGFFRRMTKVSLSGPYAQTLYALHWVILLQRLIDVVDSRYQVGILDVIQRSSRLNTDNFYNMSDQETMAEVWEDFSENGLRVSHLWTLLYYNSAGPVTVYNKRNHCSGTSVIDRVDANLLRRKVERFYGR